MAQLDRRCFQRRVSSGVSVSTSADMEALRLETGEVGGGGGGAVPSYGDVMFFLLLLFIVCLFFVFCWLLLLFWRDITTVLLSDINIYC